jgi:LysM repeat protein
LRIKPVQYIPAFLLCLLSCFSLAQVRSTNIQTIDGKKYYIHKIEKNQSVYAISKIYNQGVDIIYGINPELRNGAKAGQEIKIPYSPIAAVTPSSPVQPDTTKYITHKIQKGETVYSLLRKFNLTEKELLAYNPHLKDGLKESQLIIVGEKPKKKPREVSPPGQVTVRESPLPASPVDSFLFKPISKPSKPKYNVALILPFRLNKTIDLDLATYVKNNWAFPPVPALAIDFYLGFKAAMDSLKSEQFQVNLQLHDVDEYDSLKLNKIAVSPAFKELDFIFGPLYANGFKTIAAKAKEISVPIVSPLTQQNKILYNNIYISKTNPSQYTLLESLADYCIDSLMTNNANLILMSSGIDRRENNYVAEFKKYFNSRMQTLGRPVQDTVKHAKGLAGVQSAYLPGVKNIIVTLSNNQVFIADFTTQLAMFAHENEKDIVLCGWESLMSMDNLDQEYLNQLNFTFAHQFNITNTGSYDKIISSYKSLMETMPGEFYYIGFDVAYYYLKNLKEKGPDYIYTLDQLPAETNYMRFKFARPDNTTGFDNRGVFIFRYGNYQLHKTGWK